MIKQISIFVENKRGRMAQVTRTLSDNKIDIRALSVADTSDFGILRLIVSDVDTAYAALKKEGFTLSKTDVIGVKINDKPGGLSGVLELLAKKDMSVEYIYAFVAKNDSDAFVIMKINDDNLCGKALELLKDNGYETLDSEMIQKI